MLLLLLQFKVKAEVSIKVLLESSEPAFGAQIFFQSIPRGHSGVELADERGKANLPLQFGNTYLITISQLGYHRLTDTVKIENESEKTYQLKSKDLWLSEVVITGQYTQNNIEKSVEKIRVIDQAKIEKMAAYSLRDVLTNELNIRVTQDGILGSGMTMQGISGENVKIMIDGVPVIGRLDGNIDLSQILMHNVAQIEIVEGPMSVVYGTNALAGTINIITKKQAPQNWTTNAQVYYESIGSYNANISSVVKWKNHSFRASLARNFFDGWNPGDGLDWLPTETIADTNRTRQWNPRIQKHIDLGWNHRWNSLEVDYNFRHFDEKITNRGRPRQPYLETAFDDYYYTYRTDHSVFFRGAINPKYNFDVTSGFNNFRREKTTLVRDLTSISDVPSANPSDHDTSLFYTVMSRGSISSSYSKQINFQIGYDINHETASGLRMKEGLQQQGDYSAFFTATIDILDCWSIKPGLRITHNTSYAAPITPSLHLKYLKNKWLLRGSFARGFRAPGLKELHFFFVDINHNILGNENLNAETSHNWNASIEREIRINSWRIRPTLSGFYNAFENLISLGLVNQETQLYSYINMDRATTKGININVMVKQKNFTANMGYAYTGINNRQLAAGNINNFDFYSEFVANGSYSFGKTGLSANLFYRYQGAIPFSRINANNEIVIAKLASFGLLDFNLSQALYKQKVSLTLGAKNLMNVTNIMAAGFGGGVHSNAGSSIPMAMGRYFFLQCNFNLSAK